MDAKFVLTIVNCIFLYSDYKRTVKTVVVNNSSINVGNNHLLNKIYHSMFRWKSITWLMTGTKIKRWTS